jgi:macrolide-specific efflux system membrane fusion protein
MSSTDRVAILDAARAAGEDEKKWEDTYKPTPIISPLNGTIILRNVVPGETVTASTVLYAIADDLIVVASVDETDVGRIRTGQRAEITLDAYPDKKIAGSVFQILYEGTNVSNVITYKVKIRPGSIPSFFKSQMTANIGIITSNRSGVLLVPWNAVQEDKNGRKYVLTQTEPEQIRTPVTTGIVENNDVEIVAGLEEGETVFVKQEGYKPQVAETAKGALFGNMGSKKNTKKAGSSSKQGGPPPM